MAYQMIDLDMDTIDTEFVAMMDEVPYRLAKPVKLALIGNSESNLHMSKDYVLALKGEKINAGIFRDESEARKWIGIETDSEELGCPGGQIRTLPVIPLALDPRPISAKVKD